MKAADITDEAFLAAMDETLRLRPSNLGVTRWDLAWVLSGHQERVHGQPGYIPAPRDPGERDEPEVPQKVVLAKARKLIKRGLVSGCACGCRGDFERAEAS